MYVYAIEKSVCEKRNNLQMDRPFSIQKRSRFNGVCRFDSIQSLAEQNFSARINYLFVRAIFERLRLFSNDIARTSHLNQKLITLKIDAVSLSGLPTGSPCIKQGPFKLITSKEHGCHKPYFYKTYALYFEGNQGSRWGTKSTYVFY